MYWLRLTTTVLLACGFAIWFPQPSRSAADEPKFITPEEFDKLPVGIKVVHEPKTALATLTEKSNGGRSTLGGTKPPFLPSIAM